MRVVRYQQERILTTALQILAFLMPSAFVNPMRNGATLFVVGEVLRKRGGIVLQLAGWCAERVCLGIVVELTHASGDVFPVLASGEGVVLLLFEFFKGHAFGSATCVKAHANPLVVGFSSQIFVVDIFVNAAELLEFLGHFCDDFLVRLRLA